MKKVKEVIEVIESLAPTYLKEDFDNVGLMVGDKEKEVKKINDNMSIPLDQLFLKLVGGFHREYIYSSRTYEIPWDGIFTIRAYCGLYGQYGKVVKKFSKGELLTITITGNTAITITSNKQSASIFHIQLSGLNANVNSNSADSIRAIAIGGSGLGMAGGIARVRSNNGIAAGGGGSGGGNTTIITFTTR